VDGSVKRIGAKGDKGDAGAVLAESTIGGALRTAVDAAAARRAIGINKDLVLSSNVAGDSPSILLTGAGYYATPPDFTGGVKIAVSANIPNNRQLIFFDSAQPPTAPAIRFLLGQQVSFDAVSIDGNTRKDLGFGTGTTNVAFGGSTIPSSKSTFYGETGKQTALFLDFANSLPIQFYSFATNAISEINVGISQAMFQSYRFGGTFTVATLPSPANRLIVALSDGTFAVSTGSAWARINTTLI
jgi:hypothetical protein